MPLDVFLIFMKISKNETESRTDERDIRTASRIIGYTFAS
jgi:hypothetical protein